MERLQDGIDRKKAALEKSIQASCCCDTAAPCCDAAWRRICEDNLHMQATVLHAKKSGDDKKLQAAASKKKKLEDRAGLEKNDKGHRFRLNKCACRPGMLTQEPATHPVAMPGCGVALQGPRGVPCHQKARRGAGCARDGSRLEAAPAGRAAHQGTAHPAGRRLLCLPARDASRAACLGSGAGSCRGTDGRGEGAAHGREDMAAVQRDHVHRAGPCPAPPLLGQQAGVWLSTPTLQGARVALVGANGQGKSTLLKLMLGELCPGAGLVTRHPQAKVGLFAQNNVEALVLGRGGSSALALLKELHPGGAC